MKLMIIFLLGCLVLLAAVEAGPLAWGWNPFSWFSSRAPIRKAAYSTWSSAEQCIRKGHQGVCKGQNDPNICHTLRCKTKTGGVKKEGRPNDGTICGLASICEGGTCTTVTWSPRNWGSSTAIYPC